MRLDVHHSTTYRYDEPVPYGLQQVRMVPRTSTSQEVVDWNVDLDGGTVQVDFDDHHGNQVLLVRLDDDTTTVTTTTNGQVLTTDTGGISSQLPGPVPLWLYRRETPLTTAGPRLMALVDELPADGRAIDDVALMHELSARILDAVSYVPGTTLSTSSAEDAVELGSGVCQDHAHIFVTAARHLGMSARYVSGYLMTDEQNDQSASHAWAEVWLDALGWVAFDVSNGISADERYIQLAVGADYLDAAPISGIRFGGGTEEMAVSVRIQLAQ